MKFPLDCKDSFENSFIFWLTRYVKFKLSSLSNKELRDPKALASVNFALSREIKNIEQLDGLVKSARNAGLTGINTYFNPLKKIYETMKFYELSSLKQIDEEFAMATALVSVGTALFFFSISGFLLRLWVRMRLRNFLMRSSRATLSKTQTATNSS